MCKIQDQDQLLKTNLQTNHEILLHQMSLNL